MAEKKDTDGSALAQFAEELKAARAKAGLTRDELGTMINYSGSQIGMIENLSRVPTHEFAMLCDRVFDTPGTFVRMQARIRAEPLPEWFRPFVIHEAEATALYALQLMMVPGLLQTEDYARTLLTTRMGVSDERVERLLTGRMERQTILNRPRPPLFWAVLDEGVLRRPIGGREVMRVQSEHIVEMAQQPNVMIQIIPLQVGAYEGLNGSFVIAEFADRPSIVYLETALTGFTLEKPEHVAEVRLTYETARAEALAPAASLALMKEIAQTWT